MEPIYIDSSTIIRMDQLRNPTTDAFVNDATLVFTLQDSAGSNVPGAVAVSMGYIAGSNGRYEGEVAGAGAVSVGIPGTEYDLLVTITSARTDLRKIRCVAQYRGVR